MFNVRFRLFGCLSNPSQWTKWFIQTISVCWEYIPMQWCRNRGGPGGPLAPQYLADYPHLFLLAPPMFFTFRHHCYVFISTNQNEKKNWKKKLISGSENLGFIPEFSWQNCKIFWPEQNVLKLTKNMRHFELIFYFGKKIQSMYVVFFKYHVS